MGRSVIGDRSFVFCESSHADRGLFIIISPFRAGRITRIDGIVGLGRDREGHGCRRGFSAVIGDGDGVGVGADLKTINRFNCPARVGRQSVFGCAASDCCIGISRIQRKVCAVGMGHGDVADRFAAVIGDDNGLGVNGAVTSGLSGEARSLHGEGRICGIKFAVFIGDDDCSRFTGEVAVITFGGFHADFIGACHYIGRNICPC